MNIFKNLMKEWVIPLALVALLGWCFTQFVFTGAVVNGGSMEPNLLNRQYVGVNRLGNLQRGDVVVFDATQEDPQIRPGNKDYVKRIIGVSGDTVTYHNGNLYVNGKMVNQSYLSIGERTQGTAGEFGISWSLASLSATGMWQVKDQNKSVVPADAYFVLGDHRSVSNDGRYFGFVDRNHILGKVVVPFWYDSNVKDNINHQSQHFFG
ncbi:signal peptidase I [Convivina praedatoris]|uniref:Signal peptidase I n=1 Tax=Convivina praedatoris TaxID=2880963 RepID=A0ABN8HEA1_9LACO|nr:signal peptidase I [Convivina sp. LMG 32447]CAH1855600.1 Signal peptidase IB [Convivina sp. LMG 32447]CAH1856351.1 Signal peptidase IB [Convivina sp. LMG 32447]CAH1856644.1 Signal peptidase IB [Convivina sp. LMG 32447]